MGATVPRRDCVIGKEKVWFNNASGQVKGLRIWSETRVSGGGGGGHTGPYGGFSNPVAVTSTVTVKREFWVVTKTGQEHHIIYDEGNFSVREGQTVTVIWGASSSQNSGPYLALSNPSYNNGTVYRLSSNYEGLLYQMGLGNKGKPGKIGWIIAVVLVFILWKLFGGPSIVIDIFALLLLAAVTTVVGQKSRIRWWDDVLREAGRSV